MTLYVVMIIAKWLIIGILVIWFYQRRHKNT